MSAGSGEAGDVPNDPVSKRAAFYFGLAKYIGWPGVILLGLAYGVSCSCAWAAPILEKTVANCVVLLGKVVDTHVSTLNTVSDGQKVLAESYQKSVQIQEQSNQILSEVKENQKIFGGVLGEIHEVVVQPRKKLADKE